MCQTHYTCDRYYCLECNKKSNYSCRFGFPFNFQLHTKLFKKNSKCGSIPEFATIRNCSRINGHSPAGLAIIKENCDFKLILYLGFLENYIFKFFVKVRYLQFNFIQYSLDFLKMKIQVIFDRIQI